MFGTRRAVACVTRSRVVVRHYSVVFFGTDDVALQTLKALQESLAGNGRWRKLVTSLTVVCPSDRPAGRGKHSTEMPVKSYASSTKLRCEEVPYGL